MLSSYGFAVAGGALGTLVLVGLAVAVERVAPTLERFTLRQRIPGILMNVMGTAGGLALAWPLTFFWHWSGAAPSLMVPLWTWLEPLGWWTAMTVQILLLLVLADFLAYWRHRAEHSRWLWPVHVVHHAPTELHAANNLGHPVQALFTLVFVTLPISVIQFDGPQTPAFVGLLVGFLAIYIHSPVDIHFGRWGRRVLVDNRFHRIHHSLDARHLNKNFGICFSCWDHLFGTAYDPGEEWPAVGVAGVDPPRTLGQFLGLPYGFVKMRSSPATRLKALARRR